MLNASVICTSTFKKDFIFLPISLQKHKYISYSYWPKAYFHETPHNHSDIKFSRNQENNQLHLPPGYPEVVNVQKSNHSLLDVFAYNGLTFIPFYIWSDGLREAKQNCPKSETSSWYGPAFQPIRLSPGLAFFTPSPKCLLILTFGWF